MSKIIGILDLFSTHLDFSRYEWNVYMFLLKYMYMHRIMLKIMDKKCV